MNNKIRLSKFLDAGGVIEIRLVPDVMVFGVDTYFAANSFKSAREMMQRIIKAEALAYFHTKLPIERVIENVSFRWHGLLYTPMFDWNTFRNFVMCGKEIHYVSLRDEFVDDKVYLKATGKVYGNW